MCTETQAPVSGWTRFGVGAVAHWALDSQSPACGQHDGTLRAYPDRLSPRCVECLHYLRLRAAGITEQPAPGQQRDEAKSRRRIDGASLALLLIGICCAVVSYQAITQHGFDPLTIVPAIVAATIGATHLVKREATRGHDQEERL